jgi:hypothetical protein
LCQSGEPLPGQGGFRVDWSPPPPSAPPVTYAPYAGLIADDTGVSLGGAIAASTIAAYEQNRAGQTVRDYNSGGVWEFSVGAVQGGFYATLNAVINANCFSCSINSMIGSVVGIDLDTVPLPRADTNIGQFGQDIGPAIPWTGLMGGVRGLAKKAPGYLAHVLRGFGARQGFSGVFDASTGRILLRPSRAVAEGPLPEGWVARGGGHADVSAELGGDAARHSGFAIILQEDGTLAVTWRSGTLNPGPDGMVPPELRATIVKEIEEATGRAVSSY